MKKNTSWPVGLTYDPAYTEHFKILKREINGKEVDVIFRKGNPGMTPARISDWVSMGLVLSVSSSMADA